MPKSRIIKNIATGNVDIETSLNQLLLLANDIENTDLIKWTEKELQGYSIDDELPDYRKTNNFGLRYSGINGNFQVNNVSLQPNFLKQETLDSVITIEVRDPLSAIANYAEDSKERYRDLSWLAGEVLERSQGRIKCTNISQHIPESFFNTILSSVKQRIIRELIMLEKQYGCLDSLEIQSDSDPENIAFWDNIHERIRLQSKERYVQNFFDDASDRAILEVETCLREMFRELKPGANEPNKIGDIIGALLSEKGAYHYCDINTPNGMNFCKGFEQLIRGFFLAYRNPSSHSNQVITKKDAFERIALSSMIMNVLTSQNHYGE